MIVHEKVMEEEHIRPVEMFDTFAVRGTGKPSLAALQHFINLQSLIMFCIMDLLLNGIKRNTEIHAPQTYTS